MQKKKNKQVQEMFSFLFSNAQDARTPPLSKRMVQKKFDLIFWGG